jgi:hypothetical protein
MASVRLGSINRLYYALKPYLPWQARLVVRRWFALRKRRRMADSWPILEDAGRTPNGWPGWPDDKQFAFVLTHDVEGPRGLEKCRQLAELEMQLGFRSSFNFIPEGDYETTASLRHWLVENGFEVGVHDLNHDGWLYQSREAFRDKAVKINHYLRKWGAVGFRSGFMHHNYDWLHDLAVHYDASSFDTDPFEPQPDGVGTIFPYWIPYSPILCSEEVTGVMCEPIGPVLRSGLETQNSKPETLGTQTSASLNPHATIQKRGYVELPYTLPQDFTLFAVLKESSPEVWLRKLDWVAGRGGMALVNIHPDYLQFAGEPSTARTYPVERYAALLQHVREGYAGRYWHVLPRQVAELTAASCVQYCWSSDDARPHVRALPLCQGPQRRTAC